ncbi:MAG: c-type cytochrome, partial [Cyclobacteriaceae bacterium]|nr:c-type cytochrome [Cyclobacteriaceae bacterium]
GHIYVPFGAPSNACMEPKRTPGAPGLDPCPQLENYGGIWQFDANKLNQLQVDGKKFATGIRSVVALDWNKTDKNLYTVMHGRDDLLRLFPEKYNPWESAMLPSEEFLKVTEGSDYGWPYCYFDQLTGKKVLAPEYGGDGIMIGRCNIYEDPIMGFPGHWAPNDLLFYHGDQFPERYKNGAFIAFHGSTIRAPYPQSGYFIGFVPFENGQPSGNVEIFADGFARVDTIRNVSDAVFRPMGLAVGPTGELYIGDTEKGAIWKVMFTGDKNRFGKQHLSKMKMREQMPHFKTPDLKADNLQLNHSPAAKVYNFYCAVCHQPDGRGDGARFPPLVRTKWVTGDKDQLIGIVLNGMEGTIEVRNRTYSNVMPKHDFLSDKDVADVLTYIRQNFNNHSSAITEAEVRKVRQK